MSYMPDQTKDYDILFVPCYDIDKAHPVHSRALDFQKGQDTLYGKCRMFMRGEKYMRSFDKMEYWELVQMSVARILDCEK
jgi:hypothetical protein